MDFKTLSTVKSINLKISGLRIISKIGEGGMSVVYLAEQVSLKREVAVKVMKLEVANNDLDVQRFKHEAKIIAHLDHPNIINIYNIGQTSTGEIFFTMPYLNHGDFSNYILEDEYEFIELLQSICDGLAYAHDREIVHRDIKPENLLFDKFGNVRIADFGIAISKNGTRMTKEHQIVGSAQYMSPEQARSLKVDIHTDIYSLGIVIYERLAGRVPFDADESISILVNHVSAKPPKLPTKMRHWQPLIDKCLAKSPEDRFQSMTELKIALNKVPVNSFQRTNSSIQYLLANNIGQHLKWFIPSLLIIILVMIGFNQLGKKVIPENIQGNIPEIKIVTTATVEDEVVASVIEGKTVIEDKPVIEEKLDIPLVTLPVVAGGEKSAVPSITVTENQLIDDNELQANLSSENTINDNNEFYLDENEQPFQSNQQSAADTVILVETGEFDNTISELLIAASKNIEEYQLSKPAKNNATNQLLEVLSLDSNNQEALEGMNLIGKTYYLLIDGALRESDFNKALKHSRSLISFNRKTNEINPNIEAQKEAILSTVKVTSIADDEMTVEQVLTLSRIVKVISPNNDMIASLKQQAALKKRPVIGDNLLDEMGIETTLVTSQLAVSIHEVTVENYAEFSEATNRNPSKCKNKGSKFKNLFNSKTWEEAYFSQTPDHPVTCVSYDDALAYSVWISQNTDNRYRLPTLVEWQALAAIENNVFVPCETANLTGTESISVRNKEDKYSCFDQYKNTAPVASFNANNQGLFDVQGNVAEWINCSKQPCSGPVAMGSSWFSGKQSNVDTKSEVLKPSTGYSWVGFRLVRDL